VKVYIPSAGEQITNVATVRLVSTFFGYCKEGYTGPKCDQWSCGSYSFNSSNVCSGNGTCIAPNTCACATGYYGDNCELHLCYGLVYTSPQVCNGHGRCVFKDTCICQNGYYGDACDMFNCFKIPVDVPGVCSEKGKCIAPNNCSCDAGYYGQNCKGFNCFGIPSTDTNACGGVGIGRCISPDKCACSNGYQGARCESFKCFSVVNTESSVCSGNGTCTAPNQCQCKDPRYKGFLCETWTCWGKLRNQCQVQNISILDDGCNNRGTCIGPDQCDCLYGYYGNECQRWNCFGIPYNYGLVCSGHGACIEPNECKCNTTYHGERCEFEYSTPIWIPISVSAVVGTLLVLLVIATGAGIKYYTMVRKKRKETQKIEQLMRERLLDSHDMELGDTNQDWLIARDDLELKERLSEGSFGVVFRYVMTSMMI
jgi:hypothetical protein